MTNQVIEYIKKELGILENNVHDVEDSVLAWAHNFLSGVTPILKQVATDAVYAAFSVPGDGATRAKAAFVAASTDLIKLGIPFAKEQLRTLIKISYDAVPDDVKVANPSLPTPPSQVGVDQLAIPPVAPAV